MPTNPNNAPNFIQTHQPTTENPYLSVHHNQTSNKPPFDASLPCFNCHKPGHRRENCPYLPPPLTCFNCHKPGHKRDNCPYPQKAFTPKPCDLHPLSMPLHMNRACPDQKDDPCRLHPGALHGNLACSEQRMCDKGPNHTHLKKHCYSQSQLNPPQQHGNWHQQQTPLAFKPPTGSQFSRPPPPTFNQQNQQNVANVRQVDQQSILQGMATLLNNHGWSNQ